MQCRCPRRFANSNRFCGSADEWTIAVGLVQRTQEVFPNQSVVPHRESGSGRLLYRLNARPGHGVDISAKTTGPEWLRIPVPLWKHPDFVLHSNLDVCR